MTCPYCEQQRRVTGRWPIHLINGQPLFDLNHHAGQYVDDETSKRISEDGA